MADAEAPRPVVDVLREHADCWPFGRGHCATGGWSCKAAFGEGKTLSEHQADALAAEGYPVTAEGLSSIWNAGYDRAESDYSATGFYARKFRRDPYWERPKEADHG